MLLHFGMDHADGGHAVAFLVDFDIVEDVGAFFFQGMADFHGQQRLRQSHMQRRTMPMPDRLLSRQAPAHLRTRKTRLGQPLIFFWIMADGL